ncbi:MAG: hypothetical protein EPN85_07050 [Bacteroidetes bacterium]|nr:MAG: hypothetical protein EPN85_07050 [Bacteroidota bacterium]
MKKFAPPLKGATHFSKNPFRNLGLIFFSVFCLPPAACCFSQPYWNEWINFSQQYYKIPVSQNGIYRMDSLTLSGAGIQLSAVDPRNLQLFFRGQEQYVFVKGEADGIFNSSDYLEFYGQKNEGSLDSTLYKGDLYNKSVRQPNPYYSLFNDTSSYFLTWNNAASNKRIILSPDTSFSLAPLPTNYFMKEDIVENHTHYYYGSSTATNINFPEYHEVEGWAGINFGIGYPSSSNITSFNTSNIYSSGQSVEVKLAVMGASNDPSSSQDHNIRIQYKDISGAYLLLDQFIFDGYRLRDSVYFFPASTIGASTDLVVSALNGSFSTSRNAVPYVVLKYPHNLNLENKKYYELYVPDNLSQPKSNFSFTNFNDSASASYVYDLTNHLKIPITKSGSIYKVLVPNAITATEKLCIVKSENQFLNVQSITPVRGTGFFTNYANLGVDSAFLIITHKKLMAGATDYQNYRTSIPGGSHNVLLVDVEDLYDQFGYGIPKFPFSIRHFAEYCLDTFPAPPQNLFLLGKSVQTNYVRNQYSDPTGNNYANSLVPSIGYPTSDNMLVAVLNGNLLAPAIPIGRLAAKNGTEVTTYLNKVKEYEDSSLDPDEWMKHIIHLGGGSNSFQQSQFANYLHGYEDIIEDTSFGGYVHHFSKNSSSPTQISYTDSIRGLINKGVSIITFFGHTSATVFEFNLLPPNEYDNTNGKYPFFIADGCVAGDIHQPVAGGISSSEIYTLSDQGMIGFLASSGLGTGYEMDLFTTYLYKGIGKHLYGKSAGKCIQAAIDSIDGNAANPYMNATCLEMSLHGDPSIVIHTSKLPDYAVNNSSVFFSPGYVSSDMDSFDVNIIVTNIGKATNDSVKVTVKRTFVDGSSVSYADTIPRLYYKDTLRFTLPVDPIRGPGLNKFEVRVDSMNVVAELEDVLNNNILAPFEVPLLIYSGDIIPVHPYEYAIVPNDTITLKAYTANPFASSAQYIFEVDTTDLFSSPQKKIQYVTQMGSVVKASYNKWSSNWVLTDSTVYFWRVRKNDPDTLTYRWRESSFQYIPDKRGWGQSHFFQFLKGDKFSYIDTNRTLRYFDLDYKNPSLEVSTINYTALGGGSHFSEIYFYMDGNQMSLFSVTSSQATSTQPVKPHVLISVVDPVSGKVWPNNGTGMYGSFVQGAPYRFEFHTGTAAEQETLRQFLENTVPCGSKVILYVSDNHNLGDVLGGNNPSSVNPGLIQAFQSIGGTQFSNIRNNLPYIIIGRKCGNGTEKIGDSDSSKIFVKDTLSIKRESGKIYSEIIGPASKWKSLHWKYFSPEDISNPALAAKDTIVITLIGFDANGKADTLIKAITNDSLDILNLDQTISAATYPYLQLQAWVKDTLLHTPAQLKFWRVYYDGVPDASLNPVKGYTFYSPTVQQGDSMKMRVAIENVGDYDMDSLWVNFWVYDANRYRVTLDSIKIDSLLIDSVLIPEIKFSTENLPGGLSSLWVEANPFNNDHQLEQYHFNNIGTIPFTVDVDAINPLLDVTFDGVHIMNGDLVSAKPSIMIKLKDENTFLALNDPADFDVRIKRPGKSTYDTLSFGSSLTFEPAVLPNNSCRISYTPAFADGTYELKVQANDRSGNESGKGEYKISFEVINKPTITHVLNYPNPFSTATKFVFTLTGTEVPDFFKIQILTITGKIVKDLNKLELGPIHIGRNITEYAWNGKDEFGDQLANGLYLYRVVTQLDGKSLEHRETDADPFFTQEGYGKMYLIR